MSTPSSPAQSPSISAEALAAAAERRALQLASEPSAAQMAAEHEKRQKFRRLIDPGIVRPNPKGQATASLKTLFTIAQNLLREPDNPKYQQFKRTNAIIMRDLVEPKGTLEYAIELGFRPEVQNFQPFYTFNPRRMDDLRIGTAILKEFIDVENEKAERAARSKVDQKAVAAAVANQVKLAFMEDRKTKLLQDQREKEIRAARAAALARGAESREASPSIQQSVARPVRMPGSAHTLSSEGPPPYEEDSDDL
ncbi:putative PUB domain containing protein [Lyophyllum shimeji]|uniref:PUB domain containing protein n=1 Tax=Lyophyllum shimeji TaxID=47721 RepID=A0A9P3PE92_LYOSH|nr:putative PUB domain containing protein [Lyophyllum shimeji]